MKKKWYPEDRSDVLADIFMALVVVFGIVVVILSLTGVIDDKASCSVSVTSVTTTTEVPHG